MRNDQPSLSCAHSFPASRAFQNWKSGWSTRLFFDLAKEVRQMAKFARCPFAKTTVNCSNSFCHFHLISSVSQPQRPMINIELRDFYVQFPSKTLLGWAGGGGQHSRTHFTKACFPPGILT